MRLSRSLLSASFLVAAALLGCAGEAAKEPMVDVKVDSEGVEVQAGDVEVSADAEAGEVNVEVDSADAPAE